MQAPLRALVGCALAAILLNTWFLEGLLVPLVVEGPSMAPNLLPGRRLLVDRTAYCWRQPARWETVVLHMPDDPQSLCVKRIVGLPGETVQIAGGDVYVDGAPAARNRDVFRGAHHAPALQGLPAQYRLGPAEYFLLGDNAARSLDSRHWPTAGVAQRLFVGRAIAW